MSSLVLTGSTSGTVSVQAPAIAGSNTATIGAATGTHYPFTAGTAVASTSGTSIDFTLIPSWVKRITVMLNGVSTNGTSLVQIQIGSGSVTTTGYVSYASYSGSTTATTSSTTGFLNDATGNASSVRYGLITLTNITGNTWVEAGSGSVTTGTNYTCASGGSLALSGTLDRVRITTVNGTDTFDAGSINILYE